MKQFITKDIDYTGCHPDIANALKQGKACAEPIQAKRILKDPVSILKILVEEGWVYEFKDRVWRNGFNLFHRWDSCGREVDNYPDNFYTYEEE